MQELKERIRREGKHVGNGIIKVDAFLNHQVDAGLMRQVGQEFARRFASVGATKVLTAETSGIAPALATGMAMNVPVIFARKHHPLTMPPNPYRETATSPTHDIAVELMVSPEYLLASDCVLIIDDFLASAKTILALSRLVAQSKGKVVGIGAVIEKQYAKGRESLKGLGVPVETIAVIVGTEGDKILLAE